MNKPTKLILLVAFLFAACQFTAVLSLADKNKPRPVKITPAVEVVNKFPSVAVGTVCPRTYTDNDPAVHSENVSEGVEHEHCSKCRMGVYLKHDDTLSCSYCNHVHKG